MRRLLGIFVALAVPLAVVGAVALTTYRPGLPDMGQQALDSYLSHLRQAGQPATVIGLSRASLPRNFSADLSGPTYGNGYYFSVLHSDAPVQTANSPLAGPSITLTLKITPMVQSPGDGRPLPYPPNELWCVRLQPDLASGDRDVPSPEVVLVARYGDMFVDAWVVHELPPDTAASTLSLVECAVR